MIMKHFFTLSILGALPILGGSATSSLPNKNSNAAIQSTCELHRQRMLRRFTLMELLAQTNEKLGQSNGMDSREKELKSIIERLNTELDTLNQELGPLQESSRDGTFLGCEIM